MTEEEKDNFQKFMLQPTPFWWTIQFIISDWWYRVKPAWLRQEWPRIYHLLVCRLYGFRPIAYTYYMEHILVFETQCEADWAFYRLENTDPDTRGPLCAYWYGRKEFEETYADWNKDKQMTRAIHWINSWKDYFRKFNEGEGYGKD